ncbi:MAG: hypothetical protein PHD48_09870 [Alphaproteobacteria bacterium]|nr:hypothetical protein [Alphaproteobacteria bacterium]
MTIYPIDRVAVKREKPLSSHVALTTLKGLVLASGFHQGQSAPTCQQAKADTKRPDT